MEPNLITNIAASPSLIWVVSAIGFHLVNVFLGVFMAFQKKTPSMLRAHKYLYCAVVVSLVFYLVIHQVHSENTVWDYLIGAYFITIVPFSKRWDVLLHAFLTVVGLTLLPVMILLHFV
jgi:hypothetical protein